MNRYLVCIKVDREERPDIDQIYMDAVQAMGIHGGWPLNVFLTPDQKPFYGGTYFPPQQWMQVLQGVHKAFTERRNEVDESAAQFAEHLAAQDTSRFKKASETTAFNQDLDSSFAKLENAFDKQWGGLDKAPKFVMPSVWLWVLRYHHLTGNEAAINQLSLTLKRIGMGGIYDQLGGGFARYSVDGYWFAPHFEKMLYDNAQLMSLYAEAYTVTKDPEFKTILEETFEWLQTEMMHPEGGFFSALDADSEGEEGKFYVWTAEQVKAVLKNEAPIFMEYYSVKPEGNWEHGNNIFYRAIPDEKFLSKHNLVATEWHQKLRTQKDRMMEVRDKRVRPGLDDKIITSWNAMMVTGLADAYKATRDAGFLQAARRNIAFLERELADGTNLYRSYKSKRSNTPGFLDDYAFMIQALIRLYQVTFEDYWLKRAELLIEHTIDNFLDSNDGFFFYSGKYGEKLIASRKELFDNVIPSSNSVMALNLLEAGVLLDRPEWKKMAEDMVLSLKHIITSEPNYMSNWGIAYAAVRKGMAEVAFVGEEADELRKAFHHDHYWPFTLTMGATSESNLPLLTAKNAIDGKTTIYVCYDKACQRPVHTVAEALNELR